MQKSNRIETFYFPITPVAKGRPRFSKHGAYTPKKTRDAEKHLRDLAILTKCKPFEKGICVAVSFYLDKPKTVKREYPTVKPDLDNIIKWLGDSLNGVLWNDDAQIVEIHSVKLYADKENPTGVYLTLSEVP